MSNTICQSQKSNHEIKQMLKTIIAEEPASIKAFVAQEALDHDHQDPTMMFHNLQQAGCQAGMIGSLIYYRDTQRFFDCYYDEIEELREEYEDNVGQPLQINGDLKNWLAWFAFEETAFQLANELELEI